VLNGPQFFKPQPRKLSSEPGLTWRLILPDSQVKTESTSLKRGPPWKPALPETFHGKSKQGPYDWFFLLDCFFEVASDLRDPTSIVAFAATLLRGDALKWWGQAKTSETAEEHDFDRFKAQLCSSFRPPALSKKLEFNLPNSSRSSLPKPILPSSEQWP